MPEPTPSPPEPASQALPPPEVDASLYLHPQTLARLASFELRAKIIVEGVSSGHHRSPFQGYSVEFAQHRPYVPGDDLRHLDWKVYGKSDRLQLKQYQQETSLDLNALVDVSGSMFYGSRLFAEASGEGRKTSLDNRPQWSKFDHATALAAALAYVTLRQGDRAGLVIFADAVRAMVKRSSSQGTWRQIIGALSTHPLDPRNVGRPTDLRRAVDEMLGKVTNRGLVALISDGFFGIDQLRAGLARIKHAGHDLIFFQVLDRAELEFDFADVAPFEGLESEARLRVDPRAVRERYLELIRRHVADCEKAARSFGFDYQFVNSHDWLGPPLAAFVARRNARIKRSKYG